MKRGRELRLKIDVFTLDTLPMERLAEYMIRFAKMLGEKERVHFVALEAGSAVIVARAEPQAAEKVEKRLLESSQGRGDPIALRAWKELDSMLATDNAVGQILGPTGAEIISFPGRTRPKPLEYVPFREDGVLEGVVIRIGGKDASVPIWLQENDKVHKCNAAVSVAKRLSEHYQNGLVRVSGSGRWYRDEAGEWQTLTFDIKDFEILDDAPLDLVLGKLAEVKGANWGEDSIEQLMRLRRGEDIN